MAVVLVRRRTAPLEAWYCGLELSVPTRPSWDEMLTMDPPRARRMAGMTARVPRKTPVALMAMVRSHSARVVSSMRLPPPIPALLDRKSGVYGERVGGLGGVFCGCGGRGRGVGVGGGRRGRGGGGFGGGPGRGPAAWRG